MKKRTLKSMTTDPGTIQAFDLEMMYFDLVKVVYGYDKSAKAKLLCAFMERALDLQPDLADWIRGPEIRSLLAHYRGDLNTAAREMETQIRRIQYYHRLQAQEPNCPDHPSYGPDGLSDRLDLLAILYDDLGERPRAIQVLRESKNYCEAHDIPFDGQDILDELTAPPKPARRKAARRIAVAF